MSLILSKAHITVRWNARMAMIASLFHCNLNTCTENPDVAANACDAGSLSILNDKAFLETGSMTSIGLTAQSTRTRLTGAVTCSIQMGGIEEVLLAKYTDEIKYLRYILRR